MRYLLNCQLLLEPTQGVFSVNFVHLVVSVCVNEFFNVHISSADSNEYLTSLFNLDVDSLLAELVDSFGFSQEHNFHIVVLGSAVNKIRELRVNIVVFLGDIDGISQLVVLLFEIF